METPVSTRVATKAVMWLVVVSVFIVLPGTLGAATPRPLVLNADGFGAVHLGARESAVYAKLSHILGRPTIPIAQTPALDLCGVGAMASWHGFSVYFNHQRLVGLSLGPGKEPSGETSRGLRLGDTLKRARSLYGISLRTSGNNGGAWYVAAHKGRLDGFLSPSGAHAQGPTSRILTIDVGNVGCPAMSP